jgi:ABC-2 type transport system ATP-binding protein
VHPLQRREVTVLSNVDLRIGQGEVFGVLGPNGAGKTTLIKIFCTLILPDGGTALVNGLDVSRDGKAVRRMIGYVIGDERSFYWRLTGRQNLRFFATLNNLSTSEADRRIEDLLRLTGLEDNADKMFKDYSTGMRQRLAVARGLLRDPEILFLDEPTKSLDPVASHDLRTFIRERLVEDGRRTVVLSTNNLQEAAQLCRRVAILHAGRVTACGTLDEIQRTLSGGEGYLLRLHASRERSLAALCRVLPRDDVDILPSQAALDDGLLFRVHLRMGKDDISEIVSALVSANVKVQGCWREEMCLDEIFRRLVD